MSNQPKSHHNLSNTYFVHDQSNKDELTRLQIQNRMLVSCMGGVLPNHADPTIFQYVLDVGCGGGNWLIDVAKAYPDIASLVGIDVNERMIKHAYIIAEAQQVSDRMQFRVMDALQTLDFPADSFDLVNQRMGQSYVRVWEWQKLLSEFNRITRPGGVIQLTESEMILDGPTPAFTQLNEMLLQAFYRAGHYFTPESNGLTSNLTQLLEQAGIDNIQTHVYTLEYRAGTIEGQQLYEDTKHLFRVIYPFLSKWTQVPDDYESIYQQALSEIKQPDFVVTWKLLTAWGTKRTTLRQRQGQVLPVV